jgi:signal transduction histidine kinase/ActR/RegA family two-component response regulator
MSRKAAPRPLAEENAELRARLEVLEETLRAIRSGEVDALVVETAGEDSVFTLKSADQTYRLMVEEMHKGAATLSEDGLVLYCNPFLAALLDVPLEAVLGVRLTGFLVEGALSLSGLLQAARSGVSRGELSFRRGAGFVATEVSLTLLPLVGTPVFCMIVTDLTERKLREEERVLLEHEMSSRAAAEEANRLKDEFLATLSHELRSPLNAIVAWSHILRDPGLDPATVRRAVEVIDRNAKAQTQLVADLMDVSRIITGKFHLNLEAVRLPEVIELAAEAVRPAARARNIDLELLIDPTAGPVSGDANRLQQVIWNLLSNAIKFTPVGGSVQVLLQEAGPQVELSVRDDGPGIEPAFLPYVFDRFRQADSSSTRQHAGVGLGLAIVRHLVELHGGTVEARNREDRKGAVLVVRLPRHQGLGSRESALPSALENPHESDALPSLENVSVLLVDDEDDSREAMALGLGRHGARVATASSARAALSALARERPEVLVTDIGMADEDGYALLRKVRALPVERGGSTPAIALTGYANPQDRARTVRAGFQMHVSKPATSADLAAAVASLVARRVHSSTPER